MAEIKKIKEKLSYGTLFVLSILFWNFSGNFGLFQEWYNQAWQWLLIVGFGFMLFRKK
ncbi:MAG: hypothetical protein ABIJ34_00790 [archaeon]